LLEAGLRFARKHGIPFVIYPLTHLGAGKQPGKDSLSRFYTMRHQVELVKKSDAIVAQTPSEQAFYLHHGVAGDRIIVAGPGITPNDLLGGDGQRFRDRYHIRAPLVASISAMSYDKGTIHLIETLRHLWHSGQKIELALAGTILEPFRHYLDKLPTADRQRLHVLGPIAEEEKRGLLAACDIFAMPSRTDSFGIVYLEAWLYEKPVIGALTWGVSDVIADGRDGLLVPFGDTQALARAIAHLVAHPQKRKAMGIRGKQKVYRSHTWDQKYAPVQELYTRLINKEKA
jgi:glycosyltransferase involved in cell wall biosynthesis